MPLRSATAHRIFRSLARATRPGGASAIVPGGEYSKDLVFVGHDAIDEALRSYAASNPDPVVLDVGGGGGGKKQYFDFSGYEHRIMDLDPGFEAKGAVIGDICACPEIPDESFDVIFSYDVWEHLTEPWRAAEESVRICKPGGLLIHIAPFAWRYHPVPVDCFRYTHVGLAHLFTRTEQVTTVAAGYDISERRVDLRGHRADLRDVPPIDELGGWRENWHTIFIGRKDRPGA